jgi:hypothetical protein
MRPFTLPLELLFSTFLMNVSVLRKWAQIDVQVRTNKFTIVWKALQHPNSMSNKFTIVWFKFEGWFKFIFCLNMYHHHSSIIQT